MYRIVVKTNAINPDDPAEVRECTCHSRNMLEAFVGRYLKEVPADRTRSITITIIPAAQDFWGWGWDDRGPVRQGDDDIGCCSAYS